MSLARDMAFAKLQSRILSAAEAVQAVKLHNEILPQQQAIMLSAGDLVLARAGRPCTSHRQNWHRMRNVEDGNRAASWCNTRCRPALHSVLCGKLE